MSDPSPALDLDRAVTDRICTDGLAPPAAAEADFLAGRNDRWTRAGTGVHPAVRARALVATNRPGEAIELVGSLSGSDWKPTAIAAGAWVASRVSVPDRVTELTAMVESLEEEFVTDGELSIGPRSSLRGLLATAVGDIEESLWLHDQAISVADRRAPFRGALARMERARVLLSAACTETDPESSAELQSMARQTLMASKTFFASSGHVHLERVTARLLEFCRGLGAVQDGSVEHTGVAEPTLGYMTMVSRAGKDAWMAGFGVQPPTIVAHRKGMLAIRYLISNGHRQVPAVELDAVLRSASRSAVSREDADLLDELVALGSERAPDPAEVSERVRELIFDDNARSRITKLVRRTIAALAEEHPGLGEHLTVTVSTGYTCNYAAPPMVRWAL